MDSLSPLSQAHETLVVGHLRNQCEQTITTAAGGAAKYYILAPPWWSTSPNYRRRIPRSSWRAVFHRGGKPKHDPDARIVGQCTRAHFWNAFYLQLGGDVEADVKTAEKAAARKRNDRNNKFRRAFCLGQKKFVWDKEVQRTEEEREDVAVARTCEMVRKGHRHYELSVNGTLQYIVTGTRLFGGKTRQSLGVKGMSCSLKMVRADDHNLVAAADASVWCWKKTRLHIFPGSAAAPSAGRLLEKQEAVGLSEADEELAVWALWCMLEAEMRKRLFLLEVLALIGDVAAGAG